MTRTYRKLLHHLAQCRTKEDLDKVVARYPLSWLKFCKKGTDYAKTYLEKITSKEESS